MRRSEERKMARLLQTYQAPDPSEKHRRQTRAMALKILESKPLSMGKPFGQRLAEQAEYISPVSWILQSVLLVVVLVCAANAEDEGMVVSASVLAPLLGIVAGCELVRSYGSNMWELEMSCRYDLRSIFSIKLLIFGIVDFALLLLAAVVAGRETGEPFFTALSAVIVPFSLSNSLYLLMISRLRRRCSSYLLMGTGVFLVILQKWAVSAAEANPDGIGTAIFTSGWTFVFSLVLLSAAVALFFRPAHRKA